MAVEKGRWAVIIKETGEVSDIKRMESGKPDVRNPERYDIIEVPADVKIGMVRGEGGTFAFPAPERQAEAKAEAKDDKGDGDKADAGQKADPKVDPKADAKAADKKADAKPDKATKAA